jgi:hypothetical protein
MATSSTCFQRPLPEATTTKSDGGLPYVNPVMASPAPWQNASRDHFLLKQQTLTLQQLILIMLHCRRRIKLVQQVMA